MNSIKSLFNIAGPSEVKKENLSATQTKSKGCLRGRQQVKKTGKASLSYFSQFGIKKDLFFSDQRSEFRFIFSLFTFSLLTFSLFLSSCTQSPPPAEEHDHEHAEEANLTQLTASQQSLAGVQTGFPAERSFYRSVRCNGMIEVPPQSRYSIFSPVAGFVQSVSHYVGDPVRKGELLTHLSHPELLQKQREFLETGARLRKWEKEQARQMELDSSGATSRRLIEEAQAEYEMARAHYRGLRSELQLIGISTQKLEESSELQSRIPLRAPADGHLSEIRVNPGLLVQPQDKLFELVDDDHLHLELQVYSRDLPYIRKGQTVTFQIPGHPQKYEGDVHQVSRVVDPETKTARVHVHFEKEKALSPGVYVQAVIQVGEEKQLAVPEEGMLREGDRHFLFLVEGEGYRKQEVQAGAPHNGFVPVMDSLLSPQTEIVTRGAYYISGSMEGEREHNH